MLSFVLFSCNLDNICLQLLHITVEIKAENESYNHEINAFHVYIELAHAKLSNELVFHIVIMQIQLHFYVTNISYEILSVSYVIQEQQVPLWFGESFWSLKRSQVFLL